MSQSSSFEFLHKDLKATLPDFYTKSPVENYQTTKRIGVVGAGSKESILVKN